MIDIPNNPTNGSTITLGTTKYTYQDGKLTPFMIKQVGTELPDYELGVEVLTTERWINGKPLYRKVIYFGAGPNNTTKNVAHGITGMDILMIDGSTSGFTLGDAFLSIGDSYATSWVRTYLSGGNITISCNVNYLPAYTAIITILYTKTTDTASSPVASLYTGSLNELNLNQETHAGYRRNGKDVYQIEVDFGALPNTTTKTVVIPNYNAGYKYWLCSDSYALQSSSNTKIPLPYAGPNAGVDYNVSTYIVGDSIRIATYTNYSVFDISKVVLHYTK